MLATSLRPGFCYRVIGYIIFYRAFVQSVDFSLSKVSLTELVLKRSSASSLIKPFLELKGWQDEKSVYQVSVGLKCVCKSRIFES